MFDVTANFKKFDDEINLSLLTSITFLYSIFFRTNNLVVIAKNFVVINQLITTRICVAVIDINDENF